MSEANNQPNFTVPLFASTQEVSRLFSIGRTTLYRLRRDHPELQAMTVKTGKQILFNVPKVYEWFVQRQGGELE